MAHPQSLKCSFCSKSHKDVKKLIANDTETSYICDECVSNCLEALEISDKEPAAKKKKSAASKSSPPPSPRSLKDFLDQYVIGQDDAKEALSVAVYNHYKRLENPVIDGVEIEKSNILLCGPTGVGKTLLAQSIARVLDVPISIADTTSLTEAGYVGDDVESIITRLVQAADGDIKRAERGIVFLDEIDKKSRKDGPGGSATRDAAGEGVQQALLKLLEGTDIMVPFGSRKGPGAEFVKVNTRNILFILSGAFVGLDKIIESSATGIGFGAAIEKKKAKITDLLKRIEPDHLIRFGLIPELIGRISVIALLEELDEDQLVRVLTEPKNALVKQYVKMFALDGIELDFTQEALRSVAKLARERKTNGRALRSVLETRLLKTQFNLPDMRDQGVIKVIVGEGTIINGTPPDLISK